MDGGIHKCPRCHSEDIDVYLDGIKGLFECRSCGYRGHLSRGHKRKK